jgi:hypothetical protein
MSFSGTLQTDIAKVVVLSAFTKNELENFKK